MASYNSFSKKISVDLPLLIQEEKNYNANGLTGTLFNCSIYTGSSPLVLEKGDFTDLYNSYFRNKKKTAMRALYDEIKVKYTKVCPYCGFGEINAVDHFLPKAIFFQYSIFLNNLLPICDKCNSKDCKGEKYPLSPEEQIIHPILDKSIFFDERWIGAEYDFKNECIKYFVSPPSNWSDCDKKRVENHFEIFKLRSRYSIKASTKINGIKKQVNILKNKGLSLNEIEETLSSEVTSHSINHWKLVMYDSIISAFYNMAN